MPAGNFQRIPPSSQPDDVFSIYQILGGKFVSESWRSRLIPQFHDFRLAEVHAAAAVQIAGFREVVGAGAGEDVSGVFESGFGQGFGVGSTAGGGGGGFAVAGLKATAMSVAKSVGSLPSQTATCSGVWATVMHVPTMFNWFERRMFIGFCRF